jgi:hypothetical protein
MGAKTHGMFGTRIYGVWAAMIRRCYNKNVLGYERYGGRGIRVCKSWRKFDGFLKDVGIPRKGLTLDRINNNGNYSPSNCRWATYKEQSRNKGNNIILTHRGKSMCMYDWGRETGIGWQTIQGRIKRGWSVSDSLDSPVGSKRKDFVFLTLDGKKMPKGEWTKLLGFKSTSSITERLNRGWSLRKALTTPRSKKA